MTNPHLRQLCLPLAVLAALGLSACGAPAKNTSAPRHTSPAAAASTPRPKPSPTTLTKAQFVTKMEAVCTDFDTRMKALKPKNEQDLGGIVAGLQGTLQLFPQYIQQAEALVGRSPDKAVLTRNWLRLEKSDYAAFAPAVGKYLADVKAGNAAAVAADARALGALPDHSEAIADFMSGYGLDGCAELEGA